MEYLGSRLYTPEKISPESLMQEWRQLSQEVESVDASTLRVWQTIEIIYEVEDQKRIDCIIGKSNTPVTSVAISASCYLRIEQDSQGTTFTIVARTKKALQSVGNLIECLYEPVKRVHLDRFLTTNKELPVFAAGLSYTHQDTFETYTKPKDLGSLVQHRSSELISFFVTVNIAVPPLKVYKLYVNSKTQQAGYGIETEVRDELFLMDILFSLVDRTFGAHDPL